MWAAPWSGSPARPTRPLFPASSGRRSSLASPATDTVLSIAATFFSDAVTASFRAASSLSPRSRLLTLISLCLVILGRHLFLRGAAAVVDVPAAPALPTYSPPAPSQSLAPWPPLRSDSASPLSRTLVPVSLGGYDDVWTAPPSALPLSAARGVALLFHGCQHSGESWATSGGGSRAVVDALVAQRLLPVAFTSTDARDALRESSGGYSHLVGRGCWEIHDVAREPDNRDADMVEAVVADLSQHWFAARDVGGGGAAGGRPPLVFVGVSSGGAFAPALALRVPAEALAIYIMSVPPSVLGALSEAGAADRFPDFCIFVHMPLDLGTAIQVREDASALRSRGVRHVVEREVLPGCVGARNFTAHFTRGFFTAHAAVALTDRLTSAGALQGGGGECAELALNPRGETVAAVLEDFAGDARLTWTPPHKPPSATAPIGEWGWGGGEDVKEGGSLRANAAGGGSHSFEQARRSDALRVLRRGLREVLAEAEAGHEMTALHAKEVARLLAEPFKEEL
jgi:hypothetical protein